MAKTNLNKSFKGNKPKPETICTNPHGQKFELHKWISEYPQTHFCAECGKHHPECKCDLCEVEKK